jgi:hypothetical protein
VTDREPSGCAPVALVCGCISLFAAVALYLMSDDGYEGSLHLAFLAWFAGATAIAFFVIAVATMRRP